MKIGLHKYLINIIALIVLAGLIVGILQFKDSSAFDSLMQKSEKFTRHIKGFINAQKHNIEMDTSKRRKRPLTLIEKEESLRAYIPDVFGKFNDSEWKEFWSAIYEPVKTKQGVFSIKRRSTRDEVESYLRNRYPNPFSYFKKNHWDEMWIMIDISWDNE
ncbi:MAG: hypothetical protein ABH872_05020 [Candidatus Omnitrophota bacterium]